MRRAAVSVASNIVEGCTRKSQVECRRFVEEAIGSMKELHYQFSLADRLGYISNDSTSYKQKLEETEKVLAALLRSLNP